LSINPVNTLPAPTSSNGGIASELQVFALGGSAKQSPPPLARALQSVAHPATTHRTQALRRVAAQGFGSIPTQGVLVVRLWEAGSSNVARVPGDTV
jgi:hypothetical protein